jgi:hypothetical protein
MKPDQAEELARAAAESWLEHIDRDDTATSWSAAHSGFRAAIPQEAWSTAVRQALAPLGPFRRRSFTSAEYHSELPGAPDGHYVVLIYATAFEKKAHAIETVVPALDTDGIWRVSGYFVK